MAFKYINHWTFKCDQVSEKVSRALDDPPPFLERMGIRFHLMMCKYCARYEKQLKFIKKLMALHAGGKTPEAPLPTLPEDVRKRMKESIAKSVKKT